MRWTPRAELNNDQSALTAAFSLSGRSSIDCERHRERDAATHLLQLLRHRTGRASLMSTADAFTVTAGCTTDAKARRSAEFWMTGSALVDADAVTALSVHFGVPRRRRLVEVAEWSALSCRRAAVERWDVVDRDVRLRMMMRHGAEA